MPPQRRRPEPPHGTPERYRYMRASTDPEASKFHCDCQPCKDAMTAYNKRLRNKQGKRTRLDIYLRNRYGISLDTYERMLKNQGGKCAICRKKETAMKNGVLQRLGVDHNHATNTVRGLLCRQCNKGLGLFLDDPVALVEAARYVQTRECVNVIFIERMVS